MVRGFQGIIGVNMVPIIPQAFSIFVGPISMLALLLCASLPLASYILDLHFQPPFCRITPATFFHTISPIRAIIVSIGSS